MDYNKLAELLYPNVDKNINRFFEIYPSRNIYKDGVVTRFAPSPTGYLHIGGLYQCVFHEMLSRKPSSVFFLRLEDTDQKREIEEYFYFKEIFEQKLIVYKIIYNDIDFYEYNNYRMELVNGISYDNYLQTLSQSEISNITLIEDFVDITFFEFIEKVDNIATC